MRRRWCETRTGFNLIYENGVLIEKGKYAGEKELSHFHEHTTRGTKLIELYEKVRNLDRFNPNHCPVMEFQLSANNHQLYFLQYHRARDFRSSSHQLTRSPMQDEIVALWVRGATPPEGKEFTVGFIANPEAAPNFSHDGMVRGVGFKIFNPAYDYLTRNVGLNILRVQENRWYEDSHGLISGWMNPEVSFGVTYDQSHWIVSGSTNIDLIYRAPNPNALTAKVRVVSDGRKAYLKVLSREKLNP